MTGLLSPADVAAVVGAQLGLDCRPVRVLGERTGRCRVVQLSTSDGHLLVGKSAVDGQGRHAAAAAAALGAQDLLPLAVPRPLGYLARHRVLVQESVSGTVPSERDPGRFEQVGAALARLHASSVVLGPPTSVADHLRDLVRPHPAALARAFPALSGQIHVLLDGLLAMPACGTAPIHRDLHPRQLLLTGSRVWLLDWDLAAQGDPALDVGNLCGYLRARWPAAAADAAVAAFWAGYAPLAGPGVLARVGWFEAFAGLRLACKEYRLRGQAAEPAVTALLARARRCAGRVVEHAGV